MLPLAPCNANPTSTRKACLNLPPGLGVHYVTTLVTHATSTWASKPAIAQGYIDIIVRLALSGPLSTSNSAYQEPEHPRGQPPVEEPASVWYRALVNGFLAGLKPTEPSTGLIVRAVSRSLLEVDLQDAHGESLLQGSHTHKRKIRLWQALCVLSRYIGLEGVFGPAEVSMAWASLEHDHLPSG